MEDTARALGVALRALGEVATVVAVKADGGAVATTSIGAQVAPFLRLESLESQGIIGDDQWA